MKTFNKIMFLALISIVLIIQGCKDNILTPVTDNTATDSLVALINTLNTKLVTVNAKDNKLKIQLAKFQSSADSLNAIASNNSNFAQYVQYTVYIIDGGNSASGGNYFGGRTCKDCKTTGVDGATVTVYSNGQTYTQVSADGRAIFNGLYVAGLATVTISVNGYTSCSYTTYFNPGNNNTNAGVTINASTNVLLLPTVGKNVTTYTGQLYINKSVMDDTLGRMYSNSGDAVRYKTFISPNGPYHGDNYTYIYRNHYISDYTQNQYNPVPSGSLINFTNLITLAGVNYVYGYPTNVSSYYDLSNQYLPGDIISITYTGLTSFAVIDATGKYTLSVPAYQNSPGTTIGTASGLGSNNANLIHYQDNYTYLSSTQSTGSTNPTLKSFDPASYVVTPISSYYQVTKQFYFYPFIELDNGNYQYLGRDGSCSVSSFSTGPGQTVSRNIFFFAIKPVGQSTGS